MTKELGLSESTVRTMLKNLKESGLIRPTTFGHALTKKGKTIIETINNHISYPQELKIRQFTQHDNNIAYIINNPGKIITSCIDERDNAIRSGASGLIILIQKDELELIGTGDSRIRPPETINETMKPKKDEIIIITFAETKITSKLAGLKIALDMIGFKQDI